MNNRVKYSALLLNLILIILGAFTIYFGTKLIIATKIDLRVKEMGIAQLVIIMGSLSIILALLGGIVIWLHNNNKLLSAGVGVASIMILLEGITCTVCLTSVNDKMLHIYLTKKLISWFQSYNEDNMKKLKVDNIQRQHKCCGLKNYTYWEKQIPDSCCIKPTCNPQNSYQIGCLAAVPKAIDEMLQHNGNITLALLFATCMLTLFVVYLQHSITVQGREQIDPIQTLQALESIGAISHEERQRIQRRTQS